MILALFESGAAAEIRVALYQAPGDRARLLDAYVTTECEGAVTRSARRAAEAVLNWLPPASRPQEPLVAGFDLVGMPADHPLAGESAGLAFAIALAAQLTGRDPGSLAVTGILADGSAKALVRPVKGIAAKLDGALKIPGVATILYPSANQAEVDSALVATASGRGIRLIPVSQLDEALDALFPRDATLPSPASRKHTWPIGLLAATLFGAAVIAFIYWQTVRNGQELIAAPPSAVAIPPATPTTPVPTAQPAAPVPPVKETPVGAPAVSPVVQTVAAPPTLLATTPAKPGDPSPVAEPQPKPPAKSGGGFD